VNSAAPEGQAVHIARVFPIALLTLHRRSTEAYHSIQYMPSMIRLF